MLNLIFLILMFAVFGRVLGLAFRLTWGLARILFSVVLLPLVLLGMFFSGLVTLALPILIVIGILALLGSALS